MKKKSYIKRMNVESTVQKICNCLDALLCEAKADIETNLKIGSDKNAIHQELRRKVHVTLEKIENYPEIKSIVIKFVQTCYGRKCACDHLTFLQMCLVLLRLLQKALSQEETESCSSKTHGGCKMFMPRGLLSISQQKVLKKCFQFIVELGVLPNLLRGIGLPLSRRIQHASIFENFNTDCTCYQKHVQLVICLETLLDCLECEAMQNILFTYHGTDLFATLLQLCHSPIKKLDKTKLAAVKVPSSDKIEFRSMLAAIRDVSNHSEEEVVSLLLLHRNHFTHRLEKFLNQISPSLLIWELIIFQGIPMRIDITDMAMARCPSWMRKICNQMLTDLILQSHGITSLVQAVLDKAFDFDIENGKVETKQMEAVAHLITLNCMRHLTFENYVQRLSKQVFQLLHLKGTQMDSLLKFIAACIILQFHARDRIIGENYFFKKILDPLWKCVIDYGDHKHKSVIVEEKDLTICIEELHQIFISCTLPLRRICIKVLFPLFHCLSSLYFFLVKGSSFLKSKVKEILLEILSAATNDEALGLLYVVTIPNCSHLDVHLTTVKFGRVNEDVHLTTVKFGCGNDGGVVGIFKKRKSEARTEIPSYHALLDILSELHNKELNSSFMLLIMKEYCRFHMEVREVPYNAITLRTRLAFSALLQELSEWNADIGEALVSNVSEVIDLILTLLDNICNYRSDAPFSEETTMVVLMILSSLLTCENHSLTANDWHCIKKCIPSLHKLQQCEIDSDLREMLLSVLVHIATHGAASMNDSDDVKEFLKQYSVFDNSRISESYNDSEEDYDSSSENHTGDSLSHSTGEADKILNTSEELESHYAEEEFTKETTEKTIVLAEMDIPECLSQITLNDGVTSASNIEQSSESTECEMMVNDAANSYVPFFEDRVAVSFSEWSSKYESAVALKKSKSDDSTDFEIALEDATSPEIPIKSHGLICLGKLIQERDDEAVKNKLEIFELFQENIKDNDNYVFLPAIHGLSLVADLDIDLVIPAVLSVYHNPEEKIDMVLKMGQVILKACKLLGERLCKYRDQLFIACLIGTKHPNPEIRSSSLSNLGEACMHMKFDISGPWLQELLECVLTFLKIDRDVEVRRCAVMVVILLLRGIRRDLLQILKSNIRAVFTRLKLVRDTESDEIMCAHAQLALEEVKNVMIELILTQAAATKELRNRN